MHPRRLIVLAVLVMAPSTVRAQAPAPAVLFPAAAPAASSQPWPLPPPPRRYPSPNPPEREIGVSWSGWVSGASVRGALGMSYTRYVARDVAVEAAIDVGRDQRHYALSSVVLRTVPRDFDPPLTATVGIAHATDALPGTDGPRGLGFIVGGGGHFRFSSSLALRTDVQLLFFRDDAVSARFLVSTLIGLD